MFWEIFVFRRCLVWTSTKPHITWLRRFVVAHFLRTATRTVNQLGHDSFLPFNLSKSTLVFDTGRTREFKSFKDQGIWNLCTVTANTIYCTCCGIKGVNKVFRLHNIMNNKNRQKFFIFYSQKYKKQHDDYIYHSNITVYFLIICSHILWQEHNMMIWS